MAPRGLKDVGGGQSRWGCGKRLYVSSAGIKWDPLYIAPRCFLPILNLRNQETWLLIASQPPICSATWAKPILSLSSFPHHAVWASGLWTLLLLLGLKIVGDWATLGCVSPWLMKVCRGQAGSGLSDGAEVQYWSPVRTQQGSLLWAGGAGTSLPPPPPPGAPGLSGRQIGSLLHRLLLSPGMRTRQGSMGIVENF